MLKIIFDKSDFLVIVSDFFLKYFFKCNINFKNIILNSQIEKIKDINNIYKKIFESTLNNKGLLNEFYYD